MTDGKSGAQGKSTAQKASGKGAQPVKRRAKGTLTKDEVLGEALSLIDEQGAASCSMRNLAARLGVTAMALYSYVPSRDALLNEACAAFLTGIELRAHPGERWDDTLIRCMRMLRNECVQHPRVAALLDDPAVGAGLEPFLMRLRTLFIRQGMPEEIAIQLSVAVDALFAGFMLRSGQLVERRADAGDARGAGTSASGGRASHPADASKRLAVASRVPGMLTGRGRQDPPFVPNEHWRRTTEAGYSAASFENCLLIITEGLRACLAPNPCDWHTR